MLYLCILYLNFCICAFGTQEYNYIIIDAGRTTANKERWSYSAFGSWKAEFRNIWALLLYNIAIVRLTMLQQALLGN